MKLYYIIDCTVGIITILFALSTIGFLVAGADDLAFKYALGTLGGVTIKLILEKIP